MVQKKAKSKTSSIKRSNQLRSKLSKQGKLNKKHNRKKIRKLPKPVEGNQVNGTEVSDQENSDEDLMDMVEEEDVSFLKNAMSNNSYSFLKNVTAPSPKAETSQKQKRKSDVLDDDLDDDVDDEEVENTYLHTLKSHDERKYKHLLPIKSSDGVVRRLQEIQETPEVKSEKPDVLPVKEKKRKIDVMLETSESKEVSTAALLACRESSLKKMKFRIGVLCSGLLEDPENKIKNFFPLFEMMDTNDSELRITAKKLIIISLLEVFKDILPGYAIKHHTDPKVKLKKSVKKLYEYESELLKAYKTYLQKLEKLAFMLRKKRGDTRIFKEPELKLAEMALDCLCNLLVSYPYFNFAKNVAQLIVPFLDNPKEGVRTMTATAIKKVFREDKRGQISLDIARIISKMVKSKNNAVHPETLAVFLVLRLKDVDLDKEKEEELKKKKFEAKKHKIIRMTKREKKRNKRIKELESELLETKAEESKESKQKCLTEITKIMFALYFRVLKLTPSSKLLGTTLEGLSKFAHCINIEFYQDLISVLDNLIENENLTYKNKLCCVQTVFTVLSYQGATITVDPLKFYTHLYGNLLHIGAGRNHSDVLVILKAMDAVLLKRGKHITLQRLLAFTKRLATLSQQVLPNGSLAILRIIKQVLQAHKTVDILMDVDPSIGQGVYFPELHEPEYCNAGATALWELVALQRHYHPTLREYAKYVAKGGNNPDDRSSLKHVIKETPEQLFENFDTTEVKFNPPVPPPREFPKRKHAHTLSNDMESYIKSIFSQHKDLSDFKF